MTTDAVTSATGHLGQFIIAELLKRVNNSDRIIACVRDADKASELSEQGVTVRVADYTHPAALSAAFEGVNKLLFISSSAVGQRIKQHRNVVDAAKTANVARIAYTSILHANTTTNILAPEHKATEEYIVAQDIPYSFLRHGWYSENYIALAKTALETDVLVTNTLDGKVASAARLDYAIGDVVALLNDTGNQIHEMAGDHAWTFDELANTISAISGKPVKHQNVSKEEHIAKLVQAGQPEASAMAEATLDDNIAEGALDDERGELSRLIGRPTTLLAETLRVAL